MERREGRVQKRERGWRGGREGRVERKEGGEGGEEGMKDECCLNRLLFSHRLVIAR